MRAIASGMMNRRTLVKWIETHMVKTKTKGK